jgi:Fe2+ transport system protein FeoA
MNFESAFRVAGTEPGCPRPLCPLNRVKAGLAVRIKQLCGTPEISDRLREIGFCEDRIVKLLTSHSNIICLVCNTRLALSEQVAQNILVEPVLTRPT